MAFFLTVVILAVFVAIPEARDAVGRFSDHAEQQLAANVSYFVIAFFGSLAASAISWLISVLPRRPAQQPYRVIRRYYTY